MAVLGGARDRRPGAGWPGVIGASCPSLWSGSRRAWARLPRLASCTVRSSAPTRPRTSGPDRAGG